LISERTTSTTRGKRKTYRRTGVEKSRKKGRLEEPLKETKKKAKTHVKEWKKMGGTVSKRGRPRGKGSDAIKPKNSHEKGQEKIFPEQQKK